MYAMDMRMYDPAIARWVVQDPVVHHNFSPYSAFDNNPVFWADPSGADSETDYMGRNRFDSNGLFIAPSDRVEANYDSGMNVSEGNGGDNNGGDNKGGDENDPRMTAYSLYENGTQVLPSKEYGFNDFLNEFLNGETSRLINIGGQDFQVDIYGKIAYNNFMIKAQVPEVLTLFIGGGGSAIFKFASEASGFVHYAKHVKNLKYLWNSKQWKSISNGGSLSAEISSFSMYKKAASSFFNSRSSDIIQYANKQGTIFRYNMNTGHFGVADTKGIIQTFYKLDVNKGMKYFIEQVSKY
jgi:hypothetical protein